MTALGPDSLQVSGPRPLFTSRSFSASLLPQPAPSAQRRRSGRRRRTVAERRSGDGAEAARGDPALAEKLPQRLGQLVRPGPPDVPAALAGLLRNVAPLTALEAFDHACIPSPVAA